MSVIGYGFDPASAQLRLSFEQRTAPERVERTSSRVDTPVAPDAPNVGRIDEAAPVTERFEDFVRMVDTQQQVADQAQMDFANGTNDDVHGTMIQMQKADIQFRLLATIRNRAIEAYREVMRMGA